MDLRQLAALVAVAEHGTFSAAADALHTVQSNVSAHVRRLEQELGAQLVDRGAGRLTEEGEIVVGRARRAQAELEAMVADVAAHRHEVSGRAQLGIISTTARWLVPILLTAMRERHPKVSVVVVDATTTSLAPQVLSGRLDLAVVNLPLEDPDLLVEPLFEEDFLLVVPQHHPFACQERASVDLSELRGVELLLPPTGTAFRHELDAAAADAGVTLVPQAEIDGVRLMTSMVFQGYGAALLPASATSSWQTGTWRAMRLEGIPPRQVGMTRRRRGLLSAPARALYDAIRETVAERAGSQPGIRAA